MLSGEETPSFYRELNEIIRAPMIKNILQASREPACVSDLESIFPSNRGFVHFHILWMLKHDLLHRMK